MAESVLHFGAVTLRIDGDQNLNMSFKDMGGTTLSVLKILAMDNIARREPVRLCNLNAQRALIRLDTTDFEAYMKVNRIVIWVKELWTQYPGNV